MKHEGPIVTVDPLIVGLHAGEVYAYFIVRDREPYNGKYTLPGVYVRRNETVEQAVRRAVADKTPLVADTAVVLAPFKVYDNVGRDPRGHALSLACLVVVEPTSVDMQDLGWVKLSDCSGQQDSLFGFDHLDIASSGRKELGSQTWIAPEVLSSLLGKATATGQELFALQKQLGGSWDRANFNKHLSNIPWLVEVGQIAVGDRGRGRPSKSWRIVV